MGILRYAFVVIAVLVARAHADTDIKEADKLFEEGLALRETNLEQSCKKFRESLAKNPQAIGTLLNVALCDEKFGKIASAVERFSEAADRATEGNLPEYLAEAKSHLEKLTPDLPYLKMTFAEKPKGMRVLIGERVMSIEKLESDKGAAVDPGELEIVVSAPGRIAYETKLMIAKKEPKTVSIPELKKGVTVKSSRRTIGKIATITGGVAFATGAVLGLVARNQYKTAYDEGCVPAPGEDICEATQQEETSNAITLGWVGTIVGGVGVAAMGVGIYLWVTAPSDAKEQRQVTWMPTITPDSAGITAVGRF